MERPKRERERERKRCCTLYLTRLGGQALQQRLKAGYDRKEISYVRIKTTRRYKLNKQVLNFKNMQHPRLNMCEQQRKTQTTVMKIQHVKLNNLNVQI